jgi:hypothetical protein
MKANPKDSTLRNVQAANKRIAKLETEVKELKKRVKQLERKVK